MPFTIPNEGDAAFPEQAGVFQTCIDILVAAFRRTGVIDGCAVTAQGAPNMTVAVAAGRVAVLGIPVEVALGNVTITAAHATLPRIDLVTVDSGGVKAAVAGTAAAVPLAPALPTDKVGIAYVFVAAADTDIDPNQITDKRAEIASRIVGHPHFRYVAGQWYSNQGVNVAGSVMTQNTVFYVPLWVSGTQAFDRIGVRVFSGVATAVGRLGLFRDDGFGRPGTLIHEAAGTVDCSTSGGKELTIAQTLLGNLCWLAFVGQTAAPSLNGASQVFLPQAYPSLNDFTNHPCYTETGVTGALPGTATPVHVGSSVAPPRIALRAA